MERDYLRPSSGTEVPAEGREVHHGDEKQLLTLERHHYGGPTDYIGKCVDTVYDSDILEIYQDLRLVTVHQWDDTPYAYTRKEVHNLPGSY